MTDKRAERQNRLAEGVQDLIEMLPKDMGGWRQLMAQAAEHVEVVLGDKEQVAIVGPANSGKSTLYNQWVLGRGLPAEVSSVPGTTRSVAAADAGLFAAIDTPGADAVGPVGKQERDRALEAARGADVLVALFDATHGIREPEVELAGQLRRLRKPVVMALNKIDLIPRGERLEVQTTAAKALAMESEELVLVSAKTGENVDRLLVRIAMVEPGVVAALGRALPHYRWRLSQVVIARAASTAAAIAVTPIPFLDFIPLIGVQAAMVLSLARIHDFRINLARAREILVTFGAGVLGRTLFYELSKLSGPPGWLVGAAVAAGTTAAVGYASTVWFGRGARLEADTLKRISREIAASVVERLRDLGRRKPDRKSLRMRVEGALDDLAEVETAQQEGG